MYIHTHTYTVYNKCVHVTHKLFYAKILIRGQIFNTSICICHNHFYNEVFHLIQLLNIQDRTINTALTLSLA